jgi:hypothetical protein
MHSAIATPGEVLRAPSLLDVCTRKSYKADLHFSCCITAYGCRLAEHADPLMCAHQCAPTHAGHRGTTWQCMQLHWPTRHSLSKQSCLVSDECRHAFPFCAWEWSGVIPVASSSNWCNRQVRSHCHWLLPCHALFISKLSLLILLKASASDLCGL